MVCQLQSFQLQCLLLYLFVPIASTPLPSGLDFHFGTGRHFCFFFPSRLPYLRGWLFIWTNFSGTRGGFIFGHALNKSFRPLLGGGGFKVYVKAKVCNHGMVWMVRLCTGQLRTRKQTKLSCSQGAPSALVSTLCLRIDIVRFRASDLQYLRVIPRMNPIWWIKVVPKLLSVFVLNLVHFFINQYIFPHSTNLLCYRE